MEYAGVAGLLVEEEPEYGEVEHRQPEAHRGEVLVLLHEEVGPVADVEVGQDNRQPGQREHQAGQAVVAGAAVATAAAEAQLLWTGLLERVVFVPAQ